VSADTDHGEGDKVLIPEALQGNLSAPEFPAGLEWLNTSAPLRIRDLRGKFVLLDFWTYCCINCMHILPDLRKLEAKYDQELVVIGVHSAKFNNEKDTAQIRSAILRYDVRHPVVNDSGFEVWNSYAVNAWPTLFLISPLGKIIGKHSGEGVYEPFDAILSKSIRYFEKSKQLQRGTLPLALEQARRANTLLSFPGKISADAASGRLFISDSNNNRILVTDATGRILDVIGGGGQGREDGSFEDAQFLRPQGTFPVGGVLYIADTENHLIREANLRSRTVRTVLGTGLQANPFTPAASGRSAALNSPWDLLVLNGQMYIAMAGTHQIWVADTRTWAARRYAGSGREDIVDSTLAAAALAQPSGITTDGVRLYFADSETSSIRQADLNPGGAVTTVIGKGLFEFGDIDGGAARARLQHPLGVVYEAGLVYAADTYNSKIKVVDPAKRTVSTLAGSGKKALADGSFSAAAFNEPGGLAWLRGRLYVADTNNHQIRVLDPRAGSVTSLELSRLEKLSRAQTDKFQGRILDLGRLEIRSGKSQLSVNVVLPEGYRFNREAPFYMRWAAANQAVLKFGLRPDQVDFKSVKFPLSLPVSIQGGSSEATIDTVVYYCALQESVCLVDPIRVRFVLDSLGPAPAQTSIVIPVRKPGT
jgi:DNA-binding beta-propeller fold protein YncE